MAQAPVALQLLTGFSTRKIYRKFFIIKFVLWLAYKTERVAAPGGKLLESVSSCFSSLVPRCCCILPTPSPAVHPHFLKVDVKSSLSSLANSGQTVQFDAAGPPDLCISPAFNFSK